MLSQACYEGVCLKLMEGERHAVSQSAGAQESKQVYASKKTGMSVQQ